VKKREDNLDKISMKFDVPMLNTLVQYMLCENVSGIQLSRVNTLMKQIDTSDYEYNSDILLRLKLLKLLSEAVVENNIRDKNILRDFILTKEPDVEDILKDVSLEYNTLNESECKYVANAINERLQYLYVFKVKDQMVDLFEKIDQGGFNSYYQVMSELKQLTGQLIVKLREVDASDELIRSFSFSGDDYDHLMDVVVKKAKRPSAVLQTGMRQMNAILSPGFQSGRLYTFLGGTGKFKSGTLLNMADQIRRYNPQILPFENGMRKTILFVTCENSVEETIERLYDMYSDINDELASKTTDEVIDTLKTQGKFVFTESEGIDIQFEYRANLEINTSDIYSIIHDLADQGKKVITVILDYISRVQSTTDNNGDERLRLSYVAKELKSMAQYFQIPVITAMQLNREGNSIIDAAMRDNKQDVAQFIGSTSVGNSWSIIEESDWVCLINPEVQKSTGELFLTFKRLKIRGKKDPFAIDYFNHPFTNEKAIRLAPDIDLEKPLSVMSLASDLRTADEKELEKKTNSRPKVVNPAICSIDNLASGSVLSQIGYSA
jgi:replicative DNA helicase